MVVPSPARGQHEIIGFHRQRTAIHHGEHLLAALDGKAQRIDGVPVSPGDLACLHRLHPGDEVLHRTARQLRISEHQSAAGGVAFRHRLTSLLQDLLHVGPAPDMGNAGGHRLDEKLAIAAPADILRTVGVDLPLAAQIRGGHLGFQLAHARIGFDICHRTLPLIPRPFRSLVGLAAAAAKIVWLPY